MLGHHERLAERPNGLVLEVLRSFGQQYNGYAERGAPIVDRASSVLDGGVCTGEEPLVIRVIFSQHENVLGSFVAGTEKYVF